LDEPRRRKIKKGEKMQFSNQAMGAIMMALQESLLNQIDIVPILMGFELENDTIRGLIVKNPPTVRFSDNSEITTEQLESMGKQ
tara:strand:+ start:6765 stop:7016 length:252 start_codon:yes stop_codon:yes gene_type:complete